MRGAELRALFSKKQHVDHSDTIDLFIEDVVPLEITCEHVTEGSCVVAAEYCGGCSRVSLAGTIVNRDTASKLTRM